jgi:hypothetical protein
VVIKTIFKISNIKSRIIFFSQIMRERCTRLNFYFDRNYIVLTLFTCLKRVHVHNLYITSFRFASSSSMGDKYLQDWRLYPFAILLSHSLTKCRGITVLHNYKWYHARWRVSYNQRIYKHNKWVDGKRVR